MPDPDLEIEGGKGGGGRSPKVVSDPSAAVWSKNKGPGPFPGSSTGIIGRCK